MAIPTLRMPSSPPAKRFGFLRELAKRTVRIVVTWNVLLLCFLGTLFLFGIFGTVAALSSEVESPYETVYGSGYNQFLSIRVSGVILGSSDPAQQLSILDGGGYAYGYDIKDRLYRAASDDTLKGVILEFDSPGGTIYGSKAIADGVQYYRQQTDKPVYAHIEGVGASGAYLAAVSADKIYADYGSATGSIGVIMGPFEYYDKVLATDGGLLGGGVITQNGVESMYVSAGKSKDLGNPYRRLTGDELTALQQSVNNEYDGFVKYVSERRSISEDVIRNTVGAMTYDPKAAKELKLTDATGSRQDTYVALAKTAGYEHDYSVVREYTTPGFVESLLQAVGRKPQPQAQAREVDTCVLTRVSLAYHGDVSKWCED